MFQTEIYMEVNEKVLRDPSLINKDPYGSWILKIKGVMDVSKLKKLEEARKSFEEESQRVVR